MNESIPFLLAFIASSLSKEEIFEQIEDGLAQARQGDTSKIFIAVSLFMHKEALSQNGGLSDHLKILSDYKKANGIFEKITPTN